MHIDLHESYLLFALIQVVYALLMPASATLGEDASDFQYNFLKSGGLPLVLSMLTRNNFLPSADMETRRGAYLNALKIAKLLLTAVGFGHVKVVAEACQPNAEGTIPVSPVRPHARLTCRNTCITGSSVVDCNISIDVCSFLFSLLLLHTLIPCPVLFSD